MTFYIDLIIYGSTITGLGFYIPQFYGLYKSKNCNYYFLLPQCLLNISFGLLIWYAIEIKNRELFINNLIIFIMASIELVIMLYYSYLNGYNSLPADLQAVIDHNSTSIKTNLSKLDCHEGILKNTSLKVDSNSFAIDSQKLAISELQNELAFLKAFIIRSNQSSKELYVDDLV